MPIYRIDGFTPVPGDHAYVEADDEPGARRRLQETLVPDPDHDWLPAEVWDVRAVMRPLVALIFRD